MACRRLRGRLSRGLAWIAIALVSACGSERQETSSSGQVVAATATGTGGGGGATGSASGGAGAGDPLPDPTPDDCACLAAAAGASCRACLDEAGADACLTEHTACFDDGEGYCDLVLDCLGLCPVADAWCVDTCLGSEDEVRGRVETFAACACGACADACGSGDCEG